MAMSPTEFLEYCKKLKNEEYIASRKEEQLEDEYWSELSNLLETYPPGLPTTKRF